MRIDRITYCNGVTSFILLWLILLFIYLNTFMAFSHAMVKVNSVYAKCVQPAFSLWSHSCETWILYFVRKCDSGWTFFCSLHYKKRFEVCQNIYIFQDIVTEYQLGSYLLSYKLLDQILFTKRNMFEVRYAAPIFPLFIFFPMHPPTLGLHAVEPNLLSLKQGSNS